MHKDTNIEIEVQEMQKSWDRRTVGCKQAFGKLWEEEDMKNTAKLRGEKEKEKKTKSSRNNKKVQANLKTKLSTCLFLIGQNSQRHAGDTEDDVRVKIATKKLYQLYLTNSNKQLKNNLYIDIVWANLPCFIIE